MQGSLRLERRQGGPHGSLARNADLDFLTDSQGKHRQVILRDGELKLFAVFVAKDENLISLVQIPPHERFEIAADDIAALVGTDRDSCKLPLLFGSTFA